MCISCRFDEETNAIDIVRYLLPDFLNLILSAFNIIIMIFCSKSSNSYLRVNHSINNTDGGEADTLLNREKDKKELPEFFSFSLMPFYVLLLLLCGISVASILNFPYIILLIYFSLCWTFFANSVSYHYTIKLKPLIFVMLLYTSAHLVMLYIYQLQSVQDNIPRPSRTAR